MEDMGKIVTLEAFVPRYLNQAITFTGDDMGGDKAMMIMLLIYYYGDHGLCIRNYHQQYDTERSRCYRYTYVRPDIPDRELILHYMTLPVLVTFVGALIGNILGYTVFKGCMCRICIMEAIVFRLM